MQRTSPTITLDRTIAIGFVGSNPIDDDAPSVDAMIADLRAVLPSLHGTLFALCTLSGNTELLFAECCCSLSLPLQLILPLHADELLRQMPESLATRAHHVLQQAFHTVVPGDYDSLESGYFECRREVFERCTLLVTLVGDVDGQRASAFADKLDRAAITLHGTAGQVTCNPFVKQLQQQDKELAFLNQLPDLDIPDDAKTPEEKARRWFQKLDANANRSSRVRRIASVPILYTASAVLLSSAASRAHVGHLLMVSSAVVGLSAGASPVVLKIAQRQSAWARTRSAAEACRSMLAVWNAPFQEEIGGIEFSTELAAVMGSLRYLKLRSNVAGTLSLHDFGQQYLSQRLVDQRQYYLRQAARAQRAIRRSRLIMRTCIGVASLLALAWIGGMLHVAALTTISRSRWFSFGATVLFQVSTVVGAMEIVNDTRRRQRRYTEIARWLRTWEQQLPGLQTWASMQTLVSRAERALLIELVEWQSLIRNIKLPRGGE